MTIRHSLHSFVILLMLFTGLPLVLIISPAVGAFPATQLSNAGWMEIGSGSASGGGISSSDFDSFEPALVTIDGKAIVAWSEKQVDSHNEIYLKRWDGASWKEFSSGSASGGGISKSDGDSLRAALAVDSNGWPIVAWEDTSHGNSEIYLKHWNGTAWEALGGSATGGGISDNLSYSTRPSLVDTPDGIVVAWHDQNKDTGFYQIYVKRWNGTAWEEMGSGSASDGGISKSSKDAFTPSLALLPGGKVIIAWADTGNCADCGPGEGGEIYLKRWTGIAWEEFSSGSARNGGISNTAGNSYRASLVVDSDGLPVIAWEDNSSGNYEIYLKRWNGFAWEALGGSASKGGISNTKADSKWPSLAIGADGYPVVAWEDNSSGNYEIYVKRWNGSTWVEMGSGSAGNGGISDADPGFAYLPSLAFLANGTAIVAWESVPPIPGNHMRPDSAYNSQIYARRYVSCYQLTLTHFGEGSDPVASPSNSPDCPTGSYTYSQLISLSASPASPIKPGFGYQVYGWQDTDDDASTANANTLTMPASNHTVTVTYGPINSFMPLINYRCFEGPEEFEPNNNIGQANGPLCGGNTIIKGWPNDEYDYFKIFSIHEGTISAVVNDHYGGGPQISLFYESVSEKNLKDVDTEAKDGLEINYEDARPGIYYLVIYTEAPDPGETTPYTLHVVIP